MNYLSQETLSTLISLQQIGLSLQYVDRENTPSMFHTRPSKQVHVICPGSTPLKKSAAILGRYVVK